MRTIAFWLWLILSFPVSETGSVPLSKDFSLPLPKAWDMDRTLKCKALVSLAVHQKGILKGADKNKRCRLLNAVGVGSTESANPGLRSA